VNAGKHACPGRFFAGNEIKTMFVHLLTKYDMRTEIEGERPKDIFAGPTMLADPKAKVLFRKRSEYA
jgi:cytochrome P450